MKHRLNIEEMYGVHRSMDPPGALPQQAGILNPNPPLRPTEIQIDVEFLNIDSASWTQLRQECHDDAARMEKRILEITRAAGKMHNPVTGSGGLLVGRVSALGSARATPLVGTRVCTLISLTATPLVLDRILNLNPSSEKLKVAGRAILFASSIFVPLPHDLRDEVCLGTLDVCGAPAWAAKIVRRGMNVVVIGGGGKSGMLVTAQAARSLGGEGRVLSLCWPPETVKAAEEAGGKAVAVDCTNPLAVARVVNEEFGEELADVVFVCANVPRCEGAAILACSDEGKIVFFSMATSFTAAALTAEGLGKSPEMVIGNGYTPGHAELALNLVRSESRLQEELAF